MEQEGLGKQNDKVLELSMLAGKILLENGAEIYRVQETITRILESFGLTEPHVYVLSNGIFASVNETGGAPCQTIRNVPVAGYHLGRVSAVNELSREIAASGGQGSIQAYTRRLEEIARMPLIPFWPELLARAWASAGFCYMLGGSLWDSVAAFLAGCLLQVFTAGTRKIKWSKFIPIILGSAWVTLCSQLFLLAGIGSSLDSIIIGAIITLVPGVLLTTAIRDFFNSDYLSGTIHLVDALLVAASIAVGVGSMLRFWELIGGTI